MSSMNVEAQHAYERRKSQAKILYNYSCDDQDQSCSFQRCCCFFLLLLSIIAALVVAAAAVIIFYLKPRKPQFSLQALRLDSYKFEGSPDANIYLSSVVSLTMRAQNQNKVGIGYNPSRLDVLYSGIPVGMINVEGFYQTAHSKNVSVEMQLVLEKLNLTMISTKGLLSDSSGYNLLETQIIGDIKAFVHVLHVSLPKIKIGIDCQINFSSEEILFNKKKFDSMRGHKALSSFHPSFTKKCSIAVYI